MSTENNTRGARKLRKGVVVSKMGTKSVNVEVSYRERHPVYGKIGIKVWICKKDGFQARVQRNERRGDREGGKRHAAHA